MTETPRTAGRFYRDPDTGTLIPADETGAQTAPVSETASDTPTPDTAKATTGRTNKRK